MRIVNYPIEYYKQHKYFNVLLDRGLKPGLIRVSKTQSYKGITHFYLSYMGFSAIGKPKYALLEAWNKYKRSSEK